MPVSTRNPIALALGLIVSASVVAQVPPPAPTAQAPVNHPAQLPTFNGKVQQFTLSPRGEIDGLILSDGTEVKTPPHLSTSIAYAVKPGDSVSIRGLRAAAIPLWQATSIADQTSGRTVIDDGTDAGPGPRGPLAPDTNGLTTIQGSIRMSLHGARGELNGALLADGTILHLPPEAAMSMTTLLQPGHAVVAQGHEVSNPMGRVLEVRAIGTSRNDLTPVGAPPPPGPRGPAGGPGPLPPPPPPPPAG